MPPDYRLLMDILSPLGCLLCHVTRSCSPSAVRFKETRGDKLHFHDARTLHATDRKYEKQPVPFFCPTRCQQKFLAHVWQEAGPTAARGQSQTNSPFHGVHMLSEQEIRARFPICMLKLDDEQLRIVERFAQLKSYKVGEYHSGNFDRTLSAFARSEPFSPPGDWLTLFGRHLSHS